MELPWHWQLYCGSVDVLIRQMERASGSTETSISENECKWVVEYPEVGDERSVKIHSVIVAQLDYVGVVPPCVVAIQRQRKSSVRYLSPKSGPTWLLYGHEKRYVGGKGRALEGGRGRWPPVRFQAAEARKKLNVTPGASHN